MVVNDTHLLAAPMRLYDDVDAAIACVSGTGGIVAGFRSNDADLRPGVDAGPDAGGAQQEVLTEIGRVGGWGWILGDEGGGYHVGREAVRKVLEQADRAPLDQNDEGLSTANGDANKTGGKPTLRDRILDWFGISDVYELLTIVHMADPEPSLDEDDAALRGPSESSSAKSEPTTRPAYLRMKREKRLSSLAPLVFASAFEDNDPLALSVLRTAAQSLAEQISVFLAPPTGAATMKTKRVRADRSILCFGGSLAKVDRFRAMILAELESGGGHVFRRVEIVEDAAEVGAKALVAAATGATKA